MTQYVIDIGAVPDDGQGDPLRTAFDYTNENFNQIFDSGPVGSNVKIANNTITTTVINSNLILSPSGIGKIQINNTMLPRIDNVYDLGSPTARFNTVYLGSGGLDIAGGLIVDGNVTANYFIGNGSQLTGVVATDATNISNGTSNVNIPVISGNIIVGVSDVSNIAVFANTGAYITGVVSATGNITAPNFIGNISGNITVPGSNTQVLFNNNGLANATSGFTFDQASNLVTVGGNVSAVGFTGNGAGLANVMADRGSDPNNWDTVTQMGIYAVNRTSWSGTIGTPLDSQVYVGVLEVMNSGNTAISQIFYPGTTGADVKVQWNRNQWTGAWTAWTLMTNNGQTITGGDF